MTNKKIVFNLTLKDLKDLLLINKKLKKSKKKNKRKKIDNSIYDTPKKSSDHMKATLTNFNNLMNENLYLKNDALKHKLVINNEDALKLNPLIRNVDFDDFKIKVGNLADAVGSKFFDIEDKLDDIKNETSNKFKDYDKVKNTAYDYFKNINKKDVDTGLARHVSAHELNTTLTPQNIDSSNVVTATGGSDDFTEGQNINPPPNPTLGQINEETKQQSHVSAPILNIKKSRGRPKKILTDEEKKDNAIKNMSDREKRSIFREHATKEEKKAYHENFYNIELLDEIIKNHI